MNSNNDKRGSTQAAYSGRVKWIVITLFVTGLSLYGLLFGLLAQTPLVHAELGTEATFLGNNANSSWAADLGDIDGDGDLDIAVGNDGQANEIYQNDGAGNFSLLWTSSDSQNTKSVKLGDLDNDGDLDLAVGNQNNRNQIFENDGTGNLSLAWSSPAISNTTSIALGDLDGDGDYDLLIGNAGEPNQIYRNDGSFQFTLNWEATIAQNTQSVAIGDMNNDGSLDWVVGNAQQENEIFINNGAGVPASTIVFGFPNADTQSIALADFDQDNDLDIAVGNYLDFARIYTNEGNGVFNLYWTSTTTQLVRSIVWCDMNLDHGGALDLVLGRNGTDQILEGSGFTFEWWFSNLPESSSREMMCGDLDGDLDLELVEANGKANQGGAPNRIFFNEEFFRWKTISFIDFLAEDTTSAALGDMDNDGDLDIAFANAGQPNRIYKVDGVIEQETVTQVWSTAESYNTTHVIWGDIDNDLDLDLAYGNAGQVNQIYINEGNDTFSLGWQSSEISQTESIVFGDVDNDGDLDLGVGNYAQPNQILLNDGAGNFLPHWVSSDTQNTTSIVFGDIDNDGDLDFAVGNKGQPNQIYENDGGGVFALVWETTETNDTLSLAFGDMDGDGDLDLGVGNENQKHQIYRNDGFSFSLFWSQPPEQIRSATTLQWVDYDEDGDLDFNAGGHFYLNQALDFDTYITIGGDGAIWGDIEGDGDIEFVNLGYGSTNSIKRSDRNETLFGLPNERPRLSIDISTVASSANGYASAQIYNGILPIEYTLYDQESDPIAYVELYYSLNGGGQWLEATPAAGTQTSGLATSPQGVTYTFNWDILASGFMGQSDNVVFRMIAYPQPKAETSTHSYTYSNNVPGPTQYPAPSVTTINPIRVRGSQIRVLSNTQPISNAIVLHAPAGTEGNLEPFTSGSGSLLRTDSQGYLQGRGVLGVGDQIMALVPVETADSYTVYHTSATPNIIGLSVDTVTQLGVQTLTISSDNTLILFDLAVSLEWDAREDTAYLAQLEADLQEASRRLFDISNGQVALGKVQVFHNREQWLSANVVIHASNAMRPNADLGGSVISPTVAVLSDTTKIENGYLPGQVRMAATWNRNGDPGGTVGVDWPRALAHELAHYFLFVPDNYLGLDGGSRLIPTDCQGSVMTDAYRNDYSELLTAAEWQNDPACLQTVAALSTGRSDWETVQYFYPLLDGSGGNVGPSTLPLAVTEVAFVEPETTPDTLQDPYLNIVASDGSTLPLPYSNVQAYQFDTNGTSAATDDRIIPLGVPVGALLLTRGAGEGDRVCVFDNNHSPRRIGCNDSLSVGNHTVTMQEVADWQPEITVSPVPTATETMTESNPSRIMAITVTQAALTGDLYAQIFPVSPFTDTEPTAAPTVQLTLATGYTDTYTATVMLDDFTFEGFVQVWVPGTEKIEIASFYFGGGWGPNRYAWGPNRYAWGPNRYAWGPNRYAWGVGRMGWNAPIMSGDGQVTLFDIDYMFGDTPPYTLQSLPTVPDLPSWLTPVGEAYRVGSFEPFTSTTSILFSYLQRNVPNENYEDALRIYHLPANGSTWEALDTALDTQINQASALLQGEGSYVLAMTIELPSFSVGWNNFGYTAQTTRPVSEALASIKGKYSSVYHYDPRLSDPWLIYDATVPPAMAPLVNTLENLEFGQGYWLYATEAVTGYLPVDNRGMGSRSLNSFQLPPATFYGWVVPTAEFTPGEGMIVTAEIDGNVCGQTTVVSWAGQLAYTIQVKAENVFGTLNGCGELGKTMVFKVDGQVVDATHWWNNDQAWFHSLGAATPEMAAAPQVTIDGATVALAWNHAPQNSGGYEVWRSDTPYFMPGSSGTIMLDKIVEPPYAYTDGEASGNNNTYYYILKAKNAVSEAFSNEVGRFVFSIQPGN